MKSIVKRSLTGAVFVTMLVAATLWGPWAFLAILLLFNVLAIAEFTDLYRKTIMQPPLVFPIIIGSYLLVVGALVHWALVDAHWLIPVIPSVFLLFVAELYRKRDTPIMNVALWVLALVYISGPLMLLGGLYAYNGHDLRLVLLGMLILIWTNDTFAYLVGSQFGKRPLFKRVSPKKTREGSMGGFFFTLIVSIALYFLYGTLGYALLDLLDWVTIGLLVVLGATYGDLFESLMKRSLNVKDSGRLIPGHGGLLDRIDALLLSAPLVYSYLLLVLQ